ncbi:hypothetical protein BYT27DRAFT_6509153 [Phlegmacium glaucopus]|nr:hypothetical protein BYT27DRAFT_6509153 [Phlegmacium glaucopus]
MFLIRKNPASMLMSIVSGTRCHIWYVGTKVAIRSYFDDETFKFCRKEAIRKSVNLDTHAGGCGEQGRSCVEGYYGQIMGVMRTARSLGILLGLILSRKNLLEVNKEQVDFGK